MSRRVITTELQAAGGGNEIDTYFDRVTKYIPADVVSAWVAVKGLVQAAALDSKETVIWVCFAIGVLLTALWTLKQTAKPGKPPAVTQTAISALAFIVWALALGEPFTTMLGSAQQGLYGALVLIGFTLAVGLVTPKES